MLFRSVKLPNKNFPSINIALSLEMRPVAFEKTRPPIWVQGTCLCDSSNLNDEVSCIVNPLRLRISSGVFVLSVLDFVESESQEKLVAMANRIVNKMT